MSSQHPSGRPPIRIAVSGTGNAVQDRTDQPQVRPPIEKTPKKEKTKTKTKRTAPTDKPTPTMGLPGVAAKITTALNRPDLVLGVNKAESQQLQWAEATQVLADLADEVPFLKICFVNAKGGGATTTTAAYAVSFFADIIRGAMIVGMDFNPAQGSLGSRLGRDYGTTIDLRQMADKADELESFRGFSRAVRCSRYGVRVISASSIIKRDRAIAGTHARRILEIVNTNSEYCFADTANDITTPVSLAVIEDSDIPVFTANVAEHDSLRKLSITMETLREHGFQEKVDRSVVVISNIPKGRELTDYRKYLSMVDMNDEVTRDLDGIFRGQFLGVPNDPVIALNRVVDLDLLQWETSYSYLNVLIAILEQARLFKHNLVKPVFA